MQIPDTPLFVKTHDFNLWLLQRTQRFPKHLRHSYTVRLENLAFEFEESLLLANQARGTGRRRMLHAADGKLLCLRVLMRYAYDLKLLGASQVRFAADQFDQMGRPQWSVALDADSLTY